MYPAYKQVCTRFTAPPQWRKLLSPPFLALKQHCTCFTAPPRRWKRRCRVLPTHKQACTSFTGLPHWWKLLSPSFLALKQACMCFKAPPRWLKQRCFPHINRLAPALQDLVKTAFYIFTTPPWRWKRRCTVLRTYKQACTSFTGLPHWRKLIFSST